jgi:hypothetical protein
MTTLMQESCLSRNVRYIAGALNRRRSSAERIQRVVGESETHIRRGVRHGGAVRDRQFLIGQYLGKASRPRSAQRGSVVVLLMWVFYSAQIYLLGAEFTWLYSHSHGWREAARRRYARCCESPR